MIRRGRWLILLAMVVIAAATFGIYRARRQAIARNRPRPVVPLPANTSATANKWEYEIKAGDRARLVMRSSFFEQIKQPPRAIFKDLEMEIRQIHGKRYDLVRSAHAVLDQESNTITADGDVEIEMNLSQDPAQPSKRIVKIHTSGVTLDVASSKVTTDRHVVFEVDGGGGQCDGALYDPSTHELFLKTNAKLDRQSATPGKPPMHIEASQVVYRELPREAVLTAPSTLTRGGFKLAASGDSLVHLSPKSQIEQVDALEANGTDEMPGRMLTYSAKQVHVHFTPEGVVSKIEATENAHLTSTTDTGVTTATADRFDLDFEATPKGSLLKTALATGSARVESQPAVRKGVPPRAPRILTSNVIQIQMRPGGKEMQRVETHTPGQVEFLPAKKGDPHRWLTGERLGFDYAPGNEIESCRAVQATTRTENVGRDGKPDITLTRSQDLLAKFDPKTGQLSKLEQWTRFEYEEGTRHATSSHAILDPTPNTILLQSPARTWDETGATTADEILIDRKTGDMAAKGHVTSLRQPDKPDPKKPRSEGMMSSSEPLHATAERMKATNQRRRIHYEGNAVLWQSASRLKADRVDIDRDRHTIEAAGNVVSELPEQKGSSGKKGNVFTIVHAPALVYDDQTKLAVYSGGSRLERPNLTVNSRELRAWFVEDQKPAGGTETRLDHMFADGAVTIHEIFDGHTRDASSEHAEFYTTDERMDLTGGHPKVIDSVRGTTAAAHITYYTQQDRLIVDNTGQGPATSHVKKQNRERK
jgi:lipopolysaccharide export system protein LptA